MTGWKSGNISGHFQSDLFRFIDQQSYMAKNISVNNSIEKKLYHESFVYEFAEFDVCQTKPCHNGGRCFDRFEGYICACLEGFEGVNCQLGEDTNSISLRAISMYNCYCVFHLLHDQNMLKIWNATAHEWQNWK